MRWEVLRVATGLLAAASASAGHIFTDKAEFLAAMGDGYFLNPFDDVFFGYQGYLGYYPDDFGYEFSAPGGLFCGTGEVSTKAAGKPLVINFYDSPVTAIGGNFWVRDANFNVIPGQVTVEYADGTKDVFPSDAKGTFRGYSSGGSRISQVQVLPLGDGGAEGWAVLDNLYTYPGVFVEEDEFLQFMGWGFFNAFDDVEFGPVAKLEYGPRRGVSYTISAASGLLCNTGEVSTEAGPEPLDLAMKGNDVWMVGGRFWVRDAEFGVVPGTITLEYSDGRRDTFASADKGTFRGYRAHSAISGVRVFGKADQGDGWAAMDDLWVGQPWGNACYADCLNDGTFDYFDFLCFIDEFNAGGDYADCDSNGVFDLFDFLCYINAFSASC